MITTNSNFFAYILKDGFNEADLKDLAQTDLEKFTWNYLFAKFDKDKAFDVKYSIASEFSMLMNRHVNEHGKSNTVFGEIVRAVAKLAYREMNDGDNPEIGPYSGIWYGLKIDLECPFISADHSIEWINGFESFNRFSYVADSTYYADNMYFACLVLEQFPKFQSWKNRYDIADYYTSIVNYIVPSNVIEDFKKFNIDITDRFGTYHGFHQYNDSWTINNECEDFVISYDYHKDEYGFEIERFGMSCKGSELETLLAEYAEVFKLILKHQRSGKYHYEADMYNELEKLGYEVKDFKLLKK